MQGRKFHGAKVYPLYLDSRKMIKMLDGFFLSDFYVEDKNKWSYGSQKMAKRGTAHNFLF